MTTTDRCVQALADAGVEFVIVGGWAAIIHGSAYITNDLDICFSRGRENVRRLAGALAPFHPRPRNFPEDLPFIWDSTTLRNGTVFTLNTDLGMVDLLAEISGIGGWTEVLEHSVQAEAFDRQVRVLDLKALIESKKAAGRVKDLSLVPELESLLEARDPTSS